MPIPALIAAAATYLIPALPTIWKAAGKLSEGALKKVGDAIGDTALEAGRKVWDWVKPHAEQESKLNDAIEEVATHPDDADAQGALRVQLRKLLEAQPQLVPQLEKVVEQVQVQVGIQQNTVTASGAGAIAVGGNASGSTFTTNVNPAK